MFSIGDVVVATKGVEQGEMVVTGLSSGGFTLTLKLAKDANLPC